MCEGWGVGEKERDDEDWSQRAAYAECQTFSPRAAHNLNIDSSDWARLKLSATPITKTQLIHQTQGTEDRNEEKQGMTQSDEAHGDELVTEKTSVRSNSDLSTDLFFIDLSPLEKIPLQHC